MSWFRKLLIFISLFLLFGLGVVGIFYLLAFKPVAEPVREIIKYMPLVSRICVFLLFIILPVGILISYLQEATGKKGIILTETPDGEIYITELAIVRCIRSALREIPEVISVHSTVRKTAGGILPRIRAQVRIINRTLPEIKRQIQETVKVTMTDMLGIKNLVEPKIIIEDIKVGSEPSPPAGTIPPEITYESQV